jgi:hypothetical protein
MDYDPRRWRAPITDAPPTSAVDVDRVAAGRSTATLPEPMDLWAKHTPPDLPIGLLPPLIEQFASVQERLTGADAAGYLMAALTVCAAATPDSIRVQVKKHDRRWTEPARVWCALVARPSGKKTPIISAASGPLCSLDSQLQRDYDRQLEQYDALSAEEKKTAEPPKRVRLRMSDTTVEAAQEILKHSRDGVLVLHDEMSGFFGSMDKYSGSKGASKDRSFWLCAYNGEPFVFDRVKRGSGLIENLSISLLGGIQPDPIRAIVAESVDDGLIQRLLPIVLKPANVGTDEPLPDVVGAYDKLIRRLHTLTTATNVCSDDRTVFLLHFDEEAHQIRAQVEHRYNELAKHIEVINPKLATHMQKYLGIFPRLCVLWHAIEHADAAALPRLIPGSLANRVANFLHQFLLPHAIAFYSDILGMTDQDDKIQDVGGFILARSLDQISIRDIQRGSTRMRGLDSDQCRKILEQLEALGWVEEVAGPRTNAPRWRVMPDVHTVFAAKAAEERARRKEAQDAIKALFRA